LADNRKTLTYFVGSVQNAQTVSLVKSGVYNESHRTQRCYDVAGPRTNTRSP